LLLAFGYFDLALALAGSDLVAEVERLAMVATRQALKDADPAALLSASFRDQTFEP
jgi:hypothetical protein